MPREKDGTYRISPSALGVFRDDPRAFYLEQNMKLKRPEGIKSSMPNAIDQMMKDRYDAYRSQDKLPPELEPLAAVGGRLCPDQDMLKKLRQWNTSPVWIDPESGSGLRGALDDLVQFGDGSVAPLDVKTTSLRDNIPAYAKQYALISQSCYAVILDVWFHGVGVRDVSYLPYFMPVPGESDSKHAIAWKCELVTMPLDRAAAIQCFRDAVKCLQGPLPPATPRPPRQYTMTFDEYCVAYAKAVRAKPDVLGAAEPTGRLADDLGF